MKLNSLLPHKNQSNHKFLKYFSVIICISLFSYYFYYYLLPTHLRYKISKEIQKSYDKILVKTELFHENTLPNIRIHIKKENWGKIALNRKLALENWVPGLDRQVMVKSNEDWVSCKLELEKEKTIDAKTRLKGRLLDHWVDNDYWSLNLSIKGNDTFQGMKVFSIQHPKTRGYAVEWLFHQMLKHYGLISLRYNFCYVSINGAPEQIYAYEEGLDKRLIENNQLSEGPILKLNTDYNWFYGSLNNIRLSNTDIDIYNEKTIQNSDTQKKLSDLAIEKIDAFRNKKNKTSQTFDSKKWGLYFSILDWLGHDHAGSYDNARFYMNPTTTLIEPIGRDYSAIFKRDDKSLIGEFKTTTASFSDNWFECLFQDRQFFKDYLSSLDQISKIDFNHESFSIMKTELENIFKLLIAHDSSATPDPATIAQTLSYNRKIIYDKLNQDRKRVFAYLIQSKNDIEISAHNADSLPILLDKITIDNKTVFEWKEETWLEAYQINKPPVYQEFKITGLTNENIKQKKVFLHIKYPGTNITFQEPLLFHPSGNPTLAIDSEKLLPNLNEFSFIQVDESKKEISFTKGNYSLTKPLIIPEGFHIKAELPFTLDLTNHSFIHSQSSFYLLGSPESPIKIFSSDMSGGILILKTYEESQFQNVIFENLNTISNQNLNLTGAVNLYEAPTTFKNCQFNQNHCEDSLHIVRSKFRLLECTFENSFSDAFDGDFVNGIIESCTFIKSGNDAIDLSGSNVSILFTKINGTNDKGLSIGEKSKVTGKKIALENCEIGIASKDSSETSLSDISIKNSHLGMTAFQKKPEFSGGVLKINILKMDNIKVKYLREKDSAITIDGEEIPIADDKVKELLYGNEFGKKSH